MRKTFLAILVITISVFKSSAQVVPQPSPGASFSQTLGITKINVDYSRPGVKARTIFGGLLKYGEVWRTGANAATKIRFSNNVNINGEDINAGEYAILTIPNLDTWIVVLNTDLNATEANYDQSKDILRVSTAPYKTNFTETFTINISDIYENMAKLNFYWEHTGISLNVSVNNEAIINAAVSARNNEAAGAFQQAAEYMVNKNMNLATALKYIDKSINLQETFRNTWIKSVILRQMGRNKESLKMALNAQILGISDPVYQLYKMAIEKGIVELRASVPSYK
jgi:hypothetical protein